MFTSIVGYPRVGVLRELKFATEKYFKNEINAQQLEKVAKEIRKSQWLLQKESGIDFISSNDFSFYDNMLDTAVLFNIIPQRYLKLDLSPIDTYFAMARGYQGAAGDVKALAMKKWFNTNYHYIVPEINDYTEIKLTGTKPFEEFAEAKSLNIQTKTVVIGAFTLLKSAKFTGIKKAEDFTDDVIKAYSQLIAESERSGICWIQFDEPCLVCDLTKEDISLFEKLYLGILGAKKVSRILLQTYFGDIRDCYNSVMTLDFDGIGLDFVEGKKTMELIKNNGFPENKTIFAGVINGKNIWRNNYQTTIDTIVQLKALKINAVIGTSCSLLHVPYTTKNETKLPEKYIKHFSFAEEKLQELVQLKNLLKHRCNYIEIDVFKANAALFNNRPDCHNEEVHERTAKIKAADFIRLPDFFTREKNKRLS